MHIIDVEQGSGDWLAIRLGLISASRFKDLLTEPRSKTDKESGKLSATAEAYANELIAEIITGKQKEVSGKALEWGSEYESAARIEYDFREGAETVERGICLSDCLMFGASPDGFVGDDGMIEIKCPFNSANHVWTVINGMPPEHMPQIQGNLWINGRQWCDFISFDPRVNDDNRLYVKRIYRDKTYIASIEKKAARFAEHLKTTLKNSFGIDWQGVSIEEYI